MVGWSLTQDARDPEYAVPIFVDGNLKVGSAEADLHSSFSPIADSTLGDEHYGQGISALAENGEVTSLWAGANCVFR